MFKKWKTMSIFAKELANDIAKRYPPGLESDVTKRPSVNRLTRIIEDSCLKATEFHSENTLSWLLKAKLSNEFKWALSSLGYQKDFVDFATEAVVISLSKAKN